MSSKILRNSDFGRDSVSNRKDWEEAQILSHIAGGSCIGFGVGRETIPSHLARMRCKTLATDQSPDALNAKEFWDETGQLAKSLNDLWVPSIVTKSLFEKYVTFERMDMNALDPRPEFDYVWSCGSLEHLGSMEKSMEFIVNSLGFLKPGGRALHTTEFNLEWNQTHVSEGPNIFFRKRDILELESRLNTKGYTLMPCDFETDLTSQQIDRWPYPNKFHRVLESCGLYNTSIFLDIKECRN